MNKRRCFLRIFGVAFLLAALAGCGEQTTNVTVIQQGIPSLVPIVLQENWEVNKAVETLIGTLGHPDWYVRLQAVRALGDFGPRAIQANKALIAALNDVDATVRFEAATALGRICENARFGGIDDVVRALAGALRREGQEWFVKVAVCRALAQIGAEATSALTALHDATEDENWWVREYARWSHERISAAGQGGR